MNTKLQFKHILIISLLLTSLVIFNGCKFLGFRDESEWGHCGGCIDSDDDNVIDQKVIDLQYDFEKLEKIFTVYEEYYTFKRKEFNEFYKTRNRFNNSFFLVIPRYENRNRTIIFIAHKENFEAEYQAFRKILSSLEGTYKLYIYLETPNLLYVEKITGEIIYSKVTLSEISIHSNEPSWYYIKGKGTVKSVYLTGQHEVMGIENALTVENIYIHSTERLKSFTCNMDSTRLFYTNGTIRDNTVFPNLFDKPSKLKKIDMRNTE